MLFAFPGPSLGGATTDAFTLTATSLQTLQNLNCYQCVHPMILLGEALTTTITNTLFQTINSVATPSYSSLIRFNLKLPLTSATYSTVRKETITLTNL